MKFRLSPHVAFYLQASIITSFLAGSSAPTPLYSVYQGLWGFSPITTTMIFGIYALAVLVSLLVVGSLSDYVGRRPVLLVAIAVQMLTMLVFTFANGVPELMIARVIQGLSTGAAAGAIGAGLLDINRTKGTIANAVAAPLGTGLGSLISGLFLQFLPFPTHLVYLVLLGVFAIQAVGVWFMRETSTPTSGALASLRPEIRLPKAVVRPMLVAGPALVAIWALAGFYGAIGPALARIISGSDSHLVGGLTLFTLAFSGSLTVLALRAASPRTVILIGTVSLIVGVGLTLLAINAHSTALFFIGTVVAGVGFGGGFQGALRTIMPNAQAHERAGVISVVYVLSYLAMGLPAVIGGYLIVHAGGLVTTAREYGAAIVVLAALAIAGVLMQSRRSVDPAEVDTGIAEVSGEFAEVH
jgi:MFS family permease